MKAVDAKNEACLEIARAFGFDINKTKGIELRIHVGEIVTVKAEIYPDEKQLKHIGAILKKFKLVEIE